MAIGTRIVTAVLLMLALLELPYSYYTMLRLIVCLVFVHNVTRVVKDGSRQWVWLYGGIALLFNPLIPVHLDRVTWAIVDLGTACVSLVSIRHVQAKEAP